MGEPAAAGSPLHRRSVWTGRQTARDGLWRSRIARLGSRRFPWEVSAPVLEKAAKIDRTPKPLLRKGEVQSLQRAAAGLEKDLNSRCPARSSTSGFKRRQKTIQGNKEPPGATATGPSAEDLSRKLDREIDQPTRFCGCVPRPRCSRSARLTRGTQGSSQQRPTGAWGAGLWRRDRHRPSVKRSNPFGGVRENAARWICSFPKKVPCPIQGGNAESWKIAVSQAIATRFFVSNHTRPARPASPARAVSTLAFAHADRRDLSQAGQLLFRGQEFQGAEKDSHSPNSSAGSSPIPTSPLVRSFPTVAEAIRKSGAIGASRRTPSDRPLAGPPDRPPPVSLPLDATSAGPATHAGFRRSPHIAPRDHRHRHTAGSARESVTESVRRRQRVCGSPT